MEKNYARMSAAIDFIRANVDRQPGLAEIAAHVHLSEYHFQRLFSRWAGVTPKRYLQLLTLERAKDIIKNRSLSTLDASFHVGLSSSSRLYDHFVNIEAVTPQEFKRQGEGLTIHYGYHATAYGWMFIGVTPRGICQLAFVEDKGEAGSLSALQQQWSKATLVEDESLTQRQIDAIFSNCSSQGKVAPLSLWVRGTNFQLSVWRALLMLGTDQLTTYGELAAAIGKPKASRAVGSAVGANPIALVIPCHRVLRQNGELGGYRWGESRKQLILARELAQQEGEPQLIDGEPQPINGEPQPINGEPQPFEGKVQRYSE